jgi:hypothetical protein
VVIGGALYMGCWHHDAQRFCRHRRTPLAGGPVAVFGMGPRTVEPDAVADARKQLDLALAKVPELAPVAVAIVGGVLDPAKLRFPFKRMPASDARDWDAIRASHATCRGRWGWRRRHRRGCFRDRSRVVTLVLADYHAVVRSGLRMLLEAEPGHAVVAEAATAEDALPTRVRIDRVCS